MDLGEISRLNEKVEDLNRYNERIPKEQPTSSPVHNIERCDMKRFISYLLSLFVIGTMIMNIVETYKILESLCQLFPRNNSIHD